MLSSVSKLVDKTFVLGYVLPALLFALAALGLFGCPPWLGATCEPKTANPFAELTYAALAVYVIAVFLLTVNYSLYRILEGYVGPFSWLPQMKAWHVARHDWILKEIRRLDDDPDGDSSDETWKFLETYPRAKDEILPTAFGNAIRAFELYPKEIYGADSISVLPRLAAVIPKAFQDLINDAKSQVDFFVNLCVLMFLLGAAVLVRAAADWYQLNVAHQAVTAPVTALFAVPLFAVSVLAYFFAVSQIANWGEVVKSAFDCYLPALEKLLEYEIPKSHKGRRAFWIAFSERALYRIKFGKRFQPIRAGDAGGTQHDDAADASKDTTEGTGEAGDDDANEA